MNRIKQAAEICNQGVKEFENGAFQQALKCFKEAENLNPKLLEAILNKAAIYIKTGNIRLAEQEADKALTIFPRSFKALSIKANIIAEAGNLDEALKYADKALSCSIRETEPLIAKANVLEKKSKYCEAYLFYEKALQIKPDDITILKHLRNTATKLNNWIQAEEYALKIVEKTNLEEDFLALCSITEKNNLKKAAKTSEKALTVYPSSIAIKLCRAEILEKLEQYSDAANIYEEISRIKELENKEREDLKYRTQLLRAADDPEKLKTLTREAKYAQEINVFLIKAAIKNNYANLLSETIQYVVNDLKIQENPSAAMEIAMILIEAQEYEYAEVILNNPKLKKTGRIYFTLSLLSLKKGDDIKAEHFMKSAVALEPDNVKYLEYISGFLQKRKNYKELAATLEKLYTIQDKGNVTDEHNLIIFSFILQSQDYEKALKYVDDIKIRGNIPEAILDSLRAQIKSRIAKT